MYRKLLLIFVLLILCRIIALCTAWEGGRADTVGIQTNNNTTFINMSFMLDEVEVIGQRKLIEMKNDTTLINTINLHTPQGASLETLVKKIPGMEYDSENNILMFRGKVLNGVNINGETFMGNDIASALENLPANVVSKLKLYNMLTELENITGVSDGIEQYVLDIQTKEEYNGSIVGSLTAEHGSYYKRKDEVQINGFRANGENLSLLARADNLATTNKHKGNFQNTLSANVVKKFNKKITLNSSVLLNALHSVSENRDYDEQYLTSGVKYQNSEYSLSGKNRNINANIALKYKINERTYLNIRANVSRGNNDSQKTTRTDLYEKKTMIDSLTTGFLKLNAENKAVSYNMSADFTRRLNKAGTFVSLTAKAKGNSGTSENVSLSQTVYHQLKNIHGKDSVLLRNLFQQNPISRNDWQIGCLITQPLNRYLRLQTGYGILCKNAANERSSYDCAKNNLRIDSLGNNNNLSAAGHEIVLRIDYKSENLNVNGGMAVRPLHRHLFQKFGRFSAEISNHSMEYEPSLNIRWQKKRYSMDFFYRGHTALPDMQNLLTFGDVSNPLLTRIGNPDLRPSFSQQINLNMEDDRAGLSFTWNLNNTFNAFADKMVYDKGTGARTYQSVNVGGDWDTGGMLRWQKRMSKFILACGGGVSFSQKVNIVDDGTQTEAKKSEVRAAGGNAMLRFSYQPQWGSIDLYGGWQLRRFRNVLTETRLNTVNYDAGLSGYVVLPYHFEIKSNIDCIIRRGTYADKADDQWLWNMTVSWSFLHKKQATLSFSWNDILNRRNNIHRTVSITGYHEARSLQIGSYMLFSVKYRFNITR